MLHFELHVRYTENQPTDTITMIADVMEELNIVEQCKLNLIEELRLIPFNTEPFLRIYYSDDNVMHVIKALQKRNFGLPVQIVQMHEYSPEQMSDTHL